MKKNVFVLILLGLLSFNLFPAEDRINHFECFPMLSSDIDYQIKNELSYEECIETIKDVVYLLETSYVGFDEIEERGFDKEAFVKEAEVLFNNEAIIRNFRIYNYICDNLKPYINDSHFSVMMNTFETRFNIQQCIYLSDTYVEKTENGYKVIKSLKIPVGTQLDLSEDNVFKTIADEKEVYRVGVLSEGKIQSTKELPVSFNNKKLNLQCVSYPKYFTSNEFTVKETRRSVYINIPSFEASNEYFKQFRKFGGKYKNKKNIIIDLRQNGGGQPGTYYEFLYDLYSGRNSKKVFREFLDIINDEPIYASSPLISKQIEINNIVQEAINENFGGMYKIKTLNKKRYNGNLIFLTSKNTASAAEIIIAYSKRLFDNVLVAGTNTNGCVAFGNPYTYKLKPCGIVMNVNQMKCSGYGIPEGIGVIPDYVVSGSFEDTIRYITKDDEMAEEIN